MRISLFYPPVGNLSQPYLSTPALVAHLKKSGFSDVNQYDFNLEAADELLSAQRLERAYRWCYHYVARQATQAALSDIDATKLPLAVASLGSAARTIRDVEHAKQVLRSDQFYQRAEHDKALETLRASYRLLSSRYFPTILSNQSFSMRYRLDSSDEVLAAVADERENPFAEILSHKVGEVLSADGTPDLAGVSIGFYEQLIPGLTLAGLIKKHSPSTHVVVGGTMMTALFSKDLRPEFFELFDSVVSFDGEIPLLQLIDALELGKDLGNVSSLLFLRDGKVVRTPVHPTPLSLGEMPTPDFSGLPLGRYLSPRPILPLAASRGCYWRKCAFCTRQHLMDKYRRRSAERIVDDLEVLQQRHGARHFFFVDECISPAFLKKMADTILAARLDVRWSCYVRFEAGLADRGLCRALYASGLRMLYFGLESANQRVLDLMEKGTRKEVMARILESTSEAGILNMLLYFVGFPTETRDEALESMEFLLEHKRNVAFAIAGQFLLEEHSPVFVHPEAFDVTGISPLSPDSDLGVIHDYVTGSGMSRSQAAEAKDYINERTRELQRLEFLNRSHLLLLDGRAPVSRVPAGARDKPILAAGG